MGILNLFSKPSPTIQGLPVGSLTVDRDAQIVATTVSSSFSPALLEQIGSHVVSLFREARKAQLPLAELRLHFASLQITAREMRGGALIHLTPKDSFTTAPNV
jgi:hypothetical protein